ncbi:NicO-domain-containing protein [Pholiota conissans]|uniref:Nickel/cobalt efflux system n=1 Tax=Pholiota conissans TaxID=109636 RepID=A0A9P5ZDN2_9AGAR|nr:NicO-domain-containing protein [Pholiota conissans]
MVLKFPHLTLFGRSLLLMACEVLANAVCWAVAAILFGRNPDTRPNLGLALLAWTLGLRHALDADHISAIDNATRSLINLQQLPVTCGLFFSLGHSTIVIVVTVAIAISTGVYERINGVGEIGGIIGAAVSGSFLFIIGLANSIILWKILKRRREDKLRQQRREKGEEVPEIDRRPEENHMIMMRILGPIINFVNRPWKMFPVGFLFGLGFDTASSIALLAVSALAKKGSGGTSIPSSHIVILPLLFTAGMTLIDSADSVLMLYSYAGFPERSLTFFIRLPESVENIDSGPQDERQDIKDPEKNLVQEVAETSKLGGNIKDPVAQEIQNKMNMMSGLSIILTLMSIMVAFSISLITIMGLIGDQCKSCTAVAEADDGHGGGLAGRWWRAWAKAGDKSGYIGIAIVGAFSLIVATWYGGRWAAKKIKEKRMPSKD